MAIQKNTIYRARAATSSVCLAPLASAQMTRLNVGYSAVSGDQLPAWVAKDAASSPKMD